MKTQCGFSNHDIESSSRTSISSFSTNCILDFDMSSSNKVVSKVTSKVARKVSSKVARRQHSAIMC